MKNLIATKAAYFPSKLPLYEVDLTKNCGPNKSSYNLFFIFSRTNKLNNPTSLLLQPTIILFYSHHDPNPLLQWSTERICEQVAINPKYSRLPMINHVVTIQHH